MSFENIKKLNPSIIKSGYYFIDANVWIYSLQNLYFDEYWKNSYCEFFFNLIDSEIEPKPKIIVPTLLISEIINTYLRQIAMPEYKEIEGISDKVVFRFKEEYRKTIHCKTNIEKICDDIYSYRKNIEFFSDQDVLKDIPSMLSIPSDQFDFNDYVYYRMCQEFSKRKPITIVTNDGDFQINDIPVFTLYKPLYSLKFNKNSIS